MNEPSQKHPVLPWNDPRSSSFSNFCWSRQILYIAFVLRGEQPREAALYYNTSIRIFFRSDDSIGSSYIEKPYSLPPICRYFGVGLRSKKVKCVRKITEVRMSQVGMWLFGMLLKKWSQLQGMMSVEPFDA